MKPVFGLLFLLTTILFAVHSIQAAADDCKSYRIFAVNLNKKSLWFLYKKKPDEDETAYLCRGVEVGIYIRWIPSANCKARCRKEGGYATCEDSMCRCSMPA